MDSNLRADLAKIEDYRSKRNVLHLLSDIILTALFTVICGGNDYEDMEIFGNSHGDKLKDYLIYPNGVPSHDTFNTAFRKLPPEVFLGILRSYGHKFLQDLSEKQINIDGKKLRGASDKGRKNQGIYLVSAWVSENKLCFGQSKVEDKSNEITAIPALIESLEIKGSVISIDAIGCQTAITELIVDKEGDYLIALKGNQGNLCLETRDAFQLNEGQDAPRHESEWIEEKNGGRQEARKCTILDAQLVLPLEISEKWKGLSTLVKIDSKRDGKEETRYYISSIKFDKNKNNSLYFNALVRGHWSIENQLHWHLDVNFGEDESRIRKGYAPQNMAIIRKMALHFVQQAQQYTKKSVPKTKYKMANDINLFIELLEKSCV
jgi:predicted transposase YbfD/YdcC